MLPASATAIGDNGEAVLAQAAIELNRMGQAQKVRWPTRSSPCSRTCSPISVLPRMGVVQLEVPLHILVVAFQAMTLSGRS